jgi:hypothetical protein
MTVCGGFRATEEMKMLMLDIDAVDSARWLVNNCIDLDDRGHVERLLSPDCDYYRDGPETFRLYVDRCLADAAAIKRHDLKREQAKQLIRRRAKGAADEAAEEARCRGASAEEIENEWWSRLEEELIREGCSILFPDPSPHWDRCPF